MNPPRIPDNVVFDLDQRWIGVDERTDAGVIPGSSEVQEGSRVREARNVRFTGPIETRPAYVFSHRYNPPGPQHVTDAAWNDGKMTGSGHYTDPVSGRHHVALVRELGGAVLERRVYFCRSNGGAFMVGAGALDSLAAATREADLVRLSQIGGDVVMWRRGGLSPLLWDGDRTGQFLPIAEVDANPETPVYYEPLPAVEFACVAAGRLVFPHGTGVAWTDILDGRRWSAFDESGNANTLTVGDDGGTVTGLLWWRSGTLLVFKQRSVWAVDGFTGDLSGIAVRPISRQAGCIAPDSVVEVAGDVLWLGNGAVWSLSKVLDTDTTVNDVPVSWRVPKTMGRVNWKAAHLSRAVLARECVYFALPLDGSAVPNALLVLSSVTREWQGLDVPGGNYGAGEYHGLLRCTLWGRETFTAVRKHDALTMGWDYYDTGSDEDAGDIETYVKFRGYHAQEHSLTRWVRMEAETEEIGTEGLTFSAYGDGHGTAIPLQGSTTRDRTKWLGYGRVPRDMGNADDDFNDPGREDYSCYVGRRQVETATVAGTVTVSGNARVTITGDPLTGSPLAVSVAVLNGDSASTVAGKIRTALNAVTAITDEYEVSGAGTSVVLTARMTPGNDSTLNIAIANLTCAGLTAAPTSANTTSGIQGESPGASGLLLGQLQAHRLAGNVMGQARTLSPAITATAGKLRINVLRAAGVR